MLKLYKYMPFSTLLKFLDDPCLRVTPSSCQNDPFEFGYSRRDIQKLDSVSESKSLGNDLKSFSNLHGIISLSGSNSNILMWSHYSKNHTGAVVELIIDDNNPESLFINSTGIYSPPFLNSDVLFDKVNYSSERSYEDIAFKDDIELIKNHYYFTKAKQWDLEEEYRFITPLHWINRIVFTNDGFNNVKGILGDLVSAITCLNNNEQINYRMYELNPACIDMITATNPQLLLNIWNQSNETEIMFFIRLNPKNIGSILLGSQTNVDSFIKELNVGDNLHQTYYDVFSGEVRNVFKGEIDKNEYKLNFKDLVRCIYEE